MGQLPYLTLNWVNVPLFFKFIQEMGTFLKIDRLYKDRKVLII